MPSRQYIYKFLPKQSRALCGKGNHPPSRGYNTGRSALYGHLCIVHADLYIKTSQENLTQTWFANDACGGASIQALHKWWTELPQEGPKFGYHVNPPKTWLLAKEEHLQRAKALFDSCGINITTEGRPLLGVPIGTQSFSNDFIQEQISQWVAEVKALSSVAKTQPQAVYAANTHGLAGKWAYLSQAIEISCEQFSSLEEVMRLDFIPAISGSAVSDIERVLLALPARMGCLGLPNPASDADVPYLWSGNVTKALVDRILRRRNGPLAEVVEVQRDAFKANQRSKARRLDELSSVTKEKLPPRMKRAVIAAEEKGLRACLLPCHWRILAFHYRRKSFRMLSICAMDGPHLGFLHSACVVTRLTSTTLCRAPTVVTPQRGQRPSQRTSRRDVQQCMH